MGTDFQRDVHCLLGLPFDAVAMPDAVRLVRGAAERRAPCFVSTPNVNFLIGCLEDRQFRHSVLNSDLSIADGMPLVWIARILGVPIRERVAGSDLFLRLGRGMQRPLRVYFFGGKDGVAEAACRALNASGRGLLCAGFDTPGFGSIEEMSLPEQIAGINDSGADFLVVSLSAKKGQAWIEHNRTRITVPVISHLGAVLNFVAGTVSRAPLWMQKTGLEWLWRIKEEPALWRRYFFEGLTLGRLLFTRVLPLALQSRCGKEGAGDSAGAVLEEHDAPGGRVIVLRGRWTSSNIDRLRFALARAAAAGGAVTVNMREVTGIGSAALGSLLLLHGHQTAAGSELCLQEVPVPVRRTIRYCCAEFLLQPGAPA